MDTSYDKFFDHYVKVPSSDDDIIRMKADIQKHKYTTWADLEIGLGEYSSSCDNKDVFLKCVRNMKEELRKYLEKESEKIKLYLAPSFGEYLTFPEKILEPDPQQRFWTYVAPRQIDRINIITFNYTKTLEFLSGYSGPPIVVHGNTLLESIHHLHGTLDSMMVMGVNDPSQIKNNEFNTDEDVDEDFIKPEFNDACLNRKNIICEDLIRNANIIVIYGLSVGPSDDKWWKMIGERMESQNYPLLIYLPYDGQKDVKTYPNFMRKWTKGYIREIREKFGIFIPEAELEKRVCVGINKTLFPLTKNGAVILPKA